MKEEKINDVSASIEEVVAHNRATPTSPRIFKINKKISEKKAKELQIDLGYHPNGYGMYDFKSEEGITTWKCHYSCD